MVRGQANSPRKKSCDTDFHTQEPRRNRQRLAPAAASFVDDAVQDGGRNESSVKTPVIRATLSLIGKDDTSFSSTARISDGRGLNG